MSTTAPLSVLEYAAALPMAFALGARGGRPLDGRFGGDRATVRF